MGKVTLLLIFGCTALSQALLLSNHDRLPQCRLERKKSTISMNSSPGDSNNKLRKALGTFAVSVAVLSNALPNYVPFQNSNVALADTELSSILQEFKTVSND